MLNYVRGLYPLGRGNVGCCCIFGSEVKLRFYFWCYVYVQYMTETVPRFFLSMLTAMRHDMAELVDVDPESNTTTKFIMPVLVK